MDKEFYMLNELKTSNLVLFTEGKKTFWTKSVYNLTRDKTVSASLYISSLVSKGFTQLKGVDYFEVFSPVTRYSTNRFLLHFVPIPDGTGNIGRKVGILE